MKLKDFFFQPYYAACGKPSKHREREEQVKDAYWLISILQGINLFSLLFLSFVLFSYSISSKIILFGIFFTPLILNYFIFLKHEKKRIVERVDELIRLDELKPKKYMVVYALITMIFMAISATLYSYLK